MKRLNLLLAITALAMLPASAAAFAQEDDEQGAADNPCAAEPPDTTTLRDQKEDLSQQLDRCNGVLEPPPHADREIEEEPPDAGRTPVIPPGQLPGQQPDRM